MGFLGHTRTFKDSGNLNIVNAIKVVADAIYVFNVDARFKPYETAIISNSSASDIKVGTNYKNDFNFLVIAGDTRSLNIPFEDIRLKNVGATDIEINEVQITMRHTGEVEKNKIANKLQIVSQLAMIRNFF